MAANPLAPGYEEPVWRDKKPVRQRQLKVPGRRMRIDAACGGEFPLVLFPFLCGVGLKIEGGWPSPGSSTLCPPATMVFTPCLSPYLSTSLLRRTLMLIVEGLPVTAKGTGPLTRLHTISARIEIFMAAS